MTKAILGILLFSPLLALAQSAITITPSTVGDQTRVLAACGKDQNPVVSSCSGAQVKAWLIAIVQARVLASEVQAASQSAAQSAQATGSPGLN